jgi:hypothetical protein
MSKALILSLSAALSSAPSLGQDTLSRVHADRNNRAHVVYTNGKNVVVAAERGQMVSIQYSWREMDKLQVGWFCTQTQTEVRGLREASCCGGPAKLSADLSQIRRSGVGRFMPMLSKSHTMWAQHMEKPVRIVSSTIYRAAT